MIKEFLKPSKLKVFIFALLFVGTLLLSIIIFNTESRIGFPLPIINIQNALTSFKFLEISYGGSSSGYNYVNIVLDLIVWYLVSCLIIFAYNKVKRK